MVNMQHMMTVHDEVREAVDSGHPNHYLSDILICLERIVESAKKGRREWPEYDYAIFRLLSEDDAFMRSELGERIQSLYSESGAGIVLDR